MRVVYAVVPAGIDDPAHPSGGNAYDRRLLDALAGLGWTVVERHVGGRLGMGGVLREALSVIPDGSVVLIDGLLTTAAPGVAVTQARRLRLVVLLHMMAGGDRADLPVVGETAGEQAVLGAAAAVIVTSDWTRRQLLDRYRLQEGRVWVAEPGVVAAAAVPRRAGGTELLCVAAISPHKGQDVLLEALILIADLEWRCVLVGALDRDPEYVRRLRSRVDAGGVAGRVELTGPLTGATLDTAYAAADLLVLPSKSETYAMVVAEALAAGVPVIASDVGGVPDTLGFGLGGRRPGALVPAGDPVALAAALRDWLTDATLRAGWWSAARQRRESLTGWSVTAERASGALQALVPISVAAAAGDVDG